MLFNRLQALLIASLLLLELVLIRGCQLLQALLIAGLLLLKLVLIRGCQLLQALLIAGLLLLTRENRQFLLSCSLLHLHDHSLPQHRLSSPLSFSTLSTRLT